MWPHDGLVLNWASTLAAVRIVYTVAGLFLYPIIRWSVDGRRCMIIRWAVMSSTRITNPTSRFSFHHLNSHSTSQCFWSKLSQWRRMASSNDINQSHQYKTPLQPGVRILISPLFCRIWKNEKPLFKLKFARYFCIWKKLQNAKCKKFFLRVSSWRDVKAEKKWKMKNAKLFFLQISRIWLKNKIVANCILRCWKIRFD